MLDGIWTRSSTENTSEILPDVIEEENLTRREKRFSWSPGKNEDFNVKDITLTDAVSPRNSRNRSRPKSYAEPSVSESKRRSYQEATEGEWEKAIIDRIVQRDQAKFMKIDEYFNQLSNFQFLRKNLKFILQNIAIDTFIIQP